MTKITKLPRVFVSKRAGNNGILHVVYRNRVETYHFIQSESKKQIDESNKDCSYDYEGIFGKGWNPMHEIGVMEGNGFHEIHAAKQKDIKLPTQTEAKHEI